MKFIARHEGEEIPITVERYGAGYRVVLNDEKTLIVDMVDAGRHVRSLRLEDGSQFSLTHHRDGNMHEVTMAGAKVLVEIIDPLSLKRTSRADSSSGGGVVKALMPGRIVRVDVATGDVVEKGSGLLILEAMKMQNEIQAPAAGTVDQIFVQLGDTVDAGASLIHIAES